MESAQALLAYVLRVKRLATYLGLRSGRGCGWQELLVQVGLVPAGAIMVAQGFALVGQGSSGGGRLPLAAAAGGLMRGPRPAIPASSPSAIRRPAGRERRPRKNISSPLDFVFLSSVVTQ